jgi:thiosulfate/3-mercaptopyruvate sulfurtransferase
MLLLSGLLVTPVWLAKRLRHPALRLLDVREAASYDEGHIVGAVQVDLASLSQEVDGVPGMLLPADAFARKLGRLGVNRRKAVVIYDDHWGLPAARVLWALARYGHENAAILTGGIDRWQEEGYAIDTEPAYAAPASFRPRPRDEHLATREWLREQISEANVVLLDTRPPGEFIAGHLPGAICWDWINGVPMGSWDALRPAGELQDELSQLGVTTEKEIVTYCRTGARAAHTYLLLRHLGFPRVRLYDGSWLDWARHLNEDEKKALLKEPSYEDKS